MEKAPRTVVYLQPRRRRSGWVLASVLVAAVILLAILPQWRPASSSCACNADALGDTIHGFAGAAAPLDTLEVSPYAKFPQLNTTSPYGQFPQPNDAFRFLPCTDKTVPPVLNDTSAAASWAALFDPNPANWSWGAPVGNSSGNATTGTGDPYSGRGIFLCGYLEVPLDYLNKSDSRITRLAVTKYQVSGLARVDGAAPANSTAGKKSERTIIIEPGGPGGSGTSYAWGSAARMSTRFSDGKFDVLGWDPRGVNASRPAVECFPHDADRDRWYLLTSQHRAVVAANPRAQLEIVDAMNEAMFRACWERHGDLGRFLTTASVARDLDEIRKALGEDEVTGYLVSYGTGIGQTYAGMFPDRVGRMVLDGTEYVRDHRERGGFGWTALDNATNAWNDGFIGECLNAGPEYCALAEPRDGKAVTASGLSSRLDALLSSLIARPVPGYLKSTGPTMLTYSYLVDSIYSAMYSARRWPQLAQTFYELESGNATLAISRFESGAWYYDPELPCPEPGSPASDGELGNLVICSDSYDASEPDDMDWWLSQWQNMTAKSWIAGNSRFYTVFPCRHFNTFWPKPSEVFRGDLNHTLRTPVLLIAETYDPATPLRNGRRLAAEMGSNARMIVHHGYGHSSVDTSNCTDAAAKAYVLDGIIPKDAETNCYANEKPYLYGVTRNTTVSVAPASEPPIQVHGGGFGFRKHLGDEVE
ncbi:hypothetical protein B0H67DRAFT_482850 [Lasiosphaeris hirsuta]|uniref:Hydrolase n=1 Tax=Lasiosphaeris hirsuta TaxID=260670 RepID=A0AA40AZ88_9PEZI|nr:hypothetical protein B0H67DRAFT_482850 [Lasiosphaeris hirsuta]